MRNNQKITLFTVFTLFFALLLTSQTISGQTTIEELKVQDSERPNAVEDTHPLFSWVMSSPEKGQKQTAYQIVVTRETDKRIVWNSGKVDSGRSNNVAYLGVALQPEMAYSWEVTVWDARGTAYKKSSTFETGIMNPAQYAWEGAEFIGSKATSLDAASNLDRKSVV